MADRWTSHLSELGSMLGSAGVVVTQRHADMAEVVLWQLEFFERGELRSVCPLPSGYTLSQARSGHDGIWSVANRPLLWPDADDVAWEMEEGSICGLGMSAANPLASARVASSRPRFERRKPVRPRAIMSAHD